MIKVTQIAYSNPARVIWIDAWRVEMIEASGSDECCFTFVDSSTLIRVAESADVLAHRINEARKHAPRV